MFEAPVDGDHTKVYLVNLRSFNLEPKHDDFIREANLRVTVEDIAVLEGLYPVSDIVRCAKRSEQIRGNSSIRAVAERYGIRPDHMKNYNPSFG